MISDYNGKRIPCPVCRTWVEIEFDTARCEHCGWMAADADLDEIIEDIADIQVESSMYRFFEVIMCKNNIESEDDFICFYVRSHSTPTEEDLKRYMHDNYPETIAFDNVDSID